VSARTRSQAPSRLAPSRALSRRRMLDTAAGATVLTGLAACGSSGTDNSSTDSSGRHGSGTHSSGSAAGSGGSASSAATRTVQTAKGPVRVPVNPRRVVAIQPSALATLLDIGTSVVGAYDEGEQYVPPRYRSAFQKAAKVGDSGQINLEAVAALAPDLVIGVDYSWNTSAYGELAKLAPTVIAPTSSWAATASTVADAVGRTDRIDALAATLRQRGAALKAAHADVLGRYRWNILQGGFDPGQYWIYGPGSDIGQILAAAGVRFASASAATHGAANRSVSYELIDLLDDGDVIGFYSDFDNKPVNEGPALFAEPGFKKLTADRTGRLVPFPDFLPGGYGDALAALDELEAGLRRLRTTGAAG
jgi:iron complex transport system substrate-binding protein